MKLLPFLGKILGSVVCCVVFAIVGFITGLVFPWINRGPIETPKEDL